VSRRKPRSPVTIGLIATVVVLVLLFLGFTKDIPFTRPFEVNAVFQSANSIRVGSPVRIAGVEVGKVKTVKPEQGTDAAVVVLQIKDDGLPLHTDATAKIRPRIFLEGNFFVDLKPGTPEAPVLKDGGTLKVTQTATPVQLDEVLTSLQGDSRTDLKDLLAQLNIALNSKPTAAENRASDPVARGQTAAASFNDAYDDIPAAERSTSQVFEALLGTEPGRDLSRLIDGTARTTGALIRNENALRGLITNLNATMAAFAAESQNLRLSIRELPTTLTAADRALTSLNAAFPPTRAFAREIIPGVRETPATIAAAFPWIAQARPLMGPKELGGLARELSPATADLARLTDRAIKLLPQTNLASRCAADVVLPTGDVPIRDEFTTGVANYKEFFYTLVGLSGEGQNFDGNGMYVRFQPGGGSQTVSLGSQTSSTGQLFGNNVAVPLGNRPFYPGHRSPYRPDATCYKQKLPDLNGPAAAKSPPGPGAAPRSAAAAARTALPHLRKLLRPFGSKSEGVR
jgi:phospholipid/cholesterol/gamma-HCH transport system substrate-binding protein